MFFMNFTKGKEDEIFQLKLFNMFMQAPKFKLRGNSSRFFFSRIKK